MNINSVYLLIVTYRTERVYTSALTGGVYLDVTVAVPSPLLVIETKSVHQFTYHPAILEAVGGQRDFCFVWEVGTKG